MSKSKDKWGFSTRSIHIGNTPDKEEGSVSPPIHLTSTFKQDGVGKNRGHDYSRVSNPTRARLEANLATLDGAKHAICYSTGMAATTALFQLFDAGDHILISRNTYGGTYRMSMNVLKRQGITFDWIDTRDPENIAKHIRPNTKLVHVETPTNPLMRVSNIPTLSSLAHDAGALLSVDNTFASPFNQRPLELGADFTVHSSTKYLNGHSDVIGGLIALRDPELTEELLFIRKSSGAVPGPMDCWLTLRGIKTLYVRMRQHNANGLAIARYLENHPAVDRVYYPGLESHPQYALAVEQMDGFTGMVSVDVGTLERARALTEHLSIFALAESLGGVESLISVPALMTHASVPEDRRSAMGINPGFVRLSVGIEEEADLIRDLEGVLG